MKVRDYTHLQWSFSSSSNGGQYLKSEYIVSGKKYYYKLSDYFYGSFRSHESVLEVIASKLGILLGLPVLKYTGCVADIVLDGCKKRTFVSKSLNFCGVEQTSMPLITYYNINKIDSELPLEFCRRLGFTEFIDKMFIFDYLIMNLDRHGKNIEILSSNKGVVLAPMFDNSRCLTFGCGNSDSNIVKFDYKSSGQGNNFIGGLNLERNLFYVTKSYKLPRLNDSIRKSIFYGLSDVISVAHMEVIWEALCYRYEVLLKNGVIV